MVGQYIPVKVDLRHAESNQFVSKLFNVQLDAAPIVLLVGSNLKLLDEMRGVSPQVSTFLREGLKRQQFVRRSGDADAIKILNEAKLRIVLRSVDSALENENVAGAIKILRPFTKSKKTKTSASELVNKVAETIDRLNQQGLDDLDSARELIQEDEKQLEGLLLMAHTIRSYGGLPAMKKLLSAERKNFEETAKSLNLSGQIKSIDKARAMEETGKTALAIKAYKAIINRYPESEAETFCEQRIATLEQQ